MAPRTPRQDTLDLEVGLQRIRWGDKHRAIKRHYPEARKMPRFEIRAFGNLGHIDHFAEVDGITIRAVYEDPTYDQSLWLESTEEVEPARLIEAVTAWLGLPPKQTHTDEHGEACWKGERWMMYAYTDSDDGYPPITIAGTP